MIGSARASAIVCVVAFCGCAGGVRTPLPSTLLLSQSTGSGAAAPHASPTVFISVASINAIEAFPGGQAHPTARVLKLTGIDRPTGIAVGGSGILFVYNTGNDTITEYPPDATKPSFTLKLAAAVGNAIAAGKDDTLYVTDGDGNIDVYPPKATQPSIILQNPGQGGPEYGLGDLAVDGSKDIFVVGHGGACCGEGVFEYPAQSQNPISVQNTGGMGGGIALDGNGDLLVSPGRPRGNVIRVIHPDGSKYRFAAPEFAVMSFDRKDQYLYTTYGTVSIIDFAAEKVVGRLPYVYDAYGVAVRPAAF